MTTHSNEPVNPSRMIPNSTWFDYSEQNLRPVKPSLGKICRLITEKYLPLNFFFKKLIIFLPSFWNQNLRPSTFTNTSYLILSIFLLLALSLCIGRILNKIYLPSLAGPLIVGCLTANFGQIKELLTLPNSNNGGTLIVEIAFLIVIIRAILGINSPSLLHNLVWILKIFLNS